MISDPEQMLRMSGPEHELFGDEDSYVPDGLRLIHYIAAALLFFAAFCVGLAI